MERAAELSALGAIRCLAPAAARAQAAQLDRLASGAAGAVFAGVPFLMKDLGSAAGGLPPACGSRALLAAPEPREAELACRFRRAGLLPFGLTTVPEFGLSLSSEPAIGPQARNPLDPARTPGGSSGGAAAAVAGGIVAVAHATDAGGSIRVPAACCGLVGLKPTRGVVPGGPGFSNHLGGIAAELVVSRSLRDTAAMLDAVGGAAGGPYADPDLGGRLLPRLDHPISGLRIGLCGEADGIAIAPERAVSVRHAAEVLAQAGHAIVPIDGATLAALAADAAEVFATLIPVNLASALDDDAPVETLTKAVIRRGRQITASELWAAEALAVDVAHRMWRIFDSVEVLLTPMLSTAPPLMGAFPFDHDDIALHWRRMSAFAPYATLANVAGTPALTVPHGSDAAGLPLPVQLIGPMGQEARLLALAARLQAALPWSFRFALAGLPA